MKTAAATILSLVASASAFTSTQVPSRSATVLPAAMDNMVGSVDFRGKEFKWDPVGFGFSAIYITFFPGIT